MHGRKPKPLYRDLPFDLYVLPVTELEQNCSILVDRDNREAVLVDPGGDVEGILRVLATLRARPAKIWLTHGHFDHVGGAAKLKEAFDIPVIGPHESDAFLVEHVEEQGRFFGLPAGRSITPDKWLNEGDALDFAGATFEVRHCPGHTPGHVAFIDTAHNIGFVGDLLFQGSIGRSDLPGGSREALMQSLREKLLSLPDDFRFIPGHGMASTIGAERANNPYLTEIV